MPVRIPMRLSVAAISASDHCPAMLRITLSASSGVRRKVPPLGGSAEEVPRRPTTGPSTLAPTASGRADGLTIAPRNGNPERSTAGFRVNSVMRGRMRTLWRRREKGGLETAVAAEITAEADC